MTAQEVLERLRRVGIRRESSIGNPYWVIPERELDAIESEAGDGVLSD